MNHKALSLIACFTTVLLNAASAQAPANDAFSKAIPIVGTLGATTGNTILATSEAGDPFNSIPARNGRTLWWKWTAPSDGIFIFHTLGSAFDTLLGVYRGTALDNLMSAGFSDDDTDSRQSRLTIRAIAGQTYHIVVDGFGEESFGKLKLSWLLSPTMVYTWRDIVTVEGASAGVGGEPEWLPRTVYTSTGLVVRGRSSNVVLDDYGQEQGPVAFFHITPVKEGRRTRFFFRVSQTLPDLDSSFPGFMRGGFTSKLLMYRQTAPQRALEQVHLIEYESPGVPGYSMAVRGAASRRSPFPGAPKTRFAPTLVTNAIGTMPLSLPYPPFQGEPDWGTYQALSSTLKFSAADTTRVRGQGFEAAVETLRQHLISKGYIENTPP